MTDSNDTRAQPSNPDPAMDEFLKQLPGDEAAIQSTLSLIEQLKGGAAQRLPYTVILDVVDPLVSHTPFPVTPVNRALVVRAFVSDDRVLPEKPGRFTYCPLDKARSWGRCHRPGSSMFYAAFNLDTAISEIRPEVGQYIFAGYAKLKEEKTVLMLTIGDVDYFRRHGRLLVGDESTAQMLNQALAPMSDLQRAHTFLKDAFIADVFAAHAYRNSDYKVTAGMAEQLLLPKPGICPEGLLWPSVAYRGGLNMAVGPSTFDSKFEWTGFEAYELVGNLGYGLYGKRGIARAGAPDVGGSLNWEMAETSTGDSTAEEPQVEIRVRR